MSLSQGERRAFEQIVDSLCTQDPSFAARVRARSRRASRAGRLLGGPGHPGRPRAVVAAIAVLALAAALLVVVFAVPRRAGSVPADCAARTCAPAAGRGQPGVPLEGESAGAGSASGQAATVGMAALVEHWSER